jgi:flavin reductase (DIM6/NTAB) family NADH-FMN oxidoreductase RutF
MIDTFGSSPRDGYCMSSISNDDKEREARKSSQWIHLQEGKELSRLLYPNPVCLLCTRNITSKDGGTTASAQQANDNVMTISWLTATNNHGRFMMSLNRRRHTANYLGSKDQDFCLCVPIAGMEDLVLAVGSTSGKFGSKFRDEKNLPESLNAHGSDPQEEPPTTQQMSNRQKKKLQRQQRIGGIPGLVQVPYGAGQPQETKPTGDFVPQSTTQEEDGTGLFCIQGTVAHLHCRTYSVLEEAIDEDHYLILAEIVDAYCHVDYWEATKKLFRPRPGAKPYLTFFGSQRFGHVVVADENDTNET